LAVGSWLLAVGCWQLEVVQTIWSNSFIGTSEQRKNKVSGVSVMLSKHFYTQTDKLALFASCSVLGSARYLNQLMPTLIIQTYCTVFSTKLSLRRYGRELYGKETELCIWPMVSEGIKDRTNQLSRIVYFSFFKILLYVANWLKVWSNYFLLGRSHIISKKKTERIFFFHLTLIF
jgi:hypothetical protein